jgi:glycosyltransferase involved in cell wall biosynthesis
MRPRVLIVGNFASSWGGTTAVCESLATRLESRGWAVLTTSHKRPRLERLLDMLGTAWRTRRDYDVAIVEVYSGPAFIWAEAVCNLLTVLGKPYILSLHGGNLPEFASRRGRRVNSLLARSAAVVAQSGYLAGALPARRGLVRLIPNPIDLDLYPFRPRIFAEPRLVWLRSFHEVYNPSLAVHVVSRLRDEFPDIALTMIGPDKGDGSLGATQDLAANLGVQQRIRFQPGVPKQDVPQWLDRADLFLNTTNIDNTPVSVQEAMACGLCVVSTDVGGVPYLVRDQVEALLVSSRDADAMAEAVRRLLTTPDLSARISRAARQRVEMMDWPLVVEKWERLLLSFASTESERMPGKQCDQ